MSAKPIYSYIFRIFFDRCFHLVRHPNLCDMSPSQLVRLLAVLKFSLIEKRFLGLCFPVRRFESLFLPCCIFNLAFRSLALSFASVNYCGLDVFSTTSFNFIAFPSSSPTP
jgi:hypothetical protein